MNKITNRQFDEIKNKSISVVYFKGMGDTERDLFMSHTSIYDAYKDIEKKQRFGFIGVMITLEEDYKATQKEISKDGSFARITYDELMQIVQSNQNIILG